MNVSIRQFLSKLIGNEFSYKIFQFFTHSLPPGWGSWLNLYPFPVHLNLNLRMLISAPTDFLFAREPEIFHLSPMPCTPTFPRWAIGQLTHSLPPGHGNGIYKPAFRRCIQGRTRHSKLERRLLPFLPSIARRRSVHLYSLDKSHKLHRHMAIRFCNLHATHTNQL